MHLTSLMEKKTNIKTLTCAAKPSREFVLRLGCPHPQLLNKAQEQKLQPFNSQRLISLTAATSTHTLWTATQLHYSEVRGSHLGVR